MNEAHFLSQLYRRTYEENRGVFREWGYTTAEGKTVSLGDKEAFLAATKVYDRPLKENRHEQGSYRQGY